MTLLIALKYPAFYKILSMHFCVLSLIPSLSYASETIVDLE